MVITSRRMRWAKHVECTAKMRTRYSVFVENPKGNRQLGDLSADGRIILRFKLKGMK
jgi:hypothetical protein